MSWKKLFWVLAAFAILFGGSVMAATYSDYTSGDIMLSRPAIEPTHNYIPFVVYRKFDLSDTNINAGSGVTNGDVIRLFNVPKDSFIEEIGFRNLRKLMSGTSAEIGDGADIDGYIGNDYTQGGFEYIDLDGAASTGVSTWKHLGPFSSGVSNFQFSGVSFYLYGGNGYDTPVMRSNHGPYFKNGVSFYQGPVDTIDMTIYVDKALTVTTQVTPYFEMFIKGFKRVTD